MSFREETRINLERIRQPLLPVDILSTKEAQLLFARMLRGLSKGRLEKLEEILNWFIAAKDIQNIPYNSVFESDLSSIILKMLANKVSLQNDKNLLYAIRIVEYLTASGDPSLPDAFYSSEFIRMINGYLGADRNIEVQKHSLLILIQMFSKRELEESGEWERVIDYVEDTLVNSENEEVSALSYHLIGIWCARFADSISDRYASRMASILRTGSGLRLAFAAKGLLLGIEMGENEDLSQIYSLVSEITVSESLDSQCVIAVMRLLTCILSDATTDIVLQMSVIPYISVSNIISPNQEDDQLFDACSNFFVRAVEFPALDKIIIEQNIIQQYTKTALLGSFSVRRKSLEVLFRSIISGNNEYTAIAVSCGLIESFEGMTFSNPGPLLRAIAVMIQKKSLDSEEKGKIIHILEGFLDQSAELSQLSAAILQAL